MVDIKFVRRLPHFVPLWVLKDVAAAPPSAGQLSKERPANGGVDHDNEKGANEKVGTSNPGEFHVSEYLTAIDLIAIREMTLLRRGRLSVQDVSPEAYEAIVTMGEKGGWEVEAVKRDATKGRGVAGKKRKVVGTKGSAEEDGNENQVSRKRTRMVKGSRDNADSDTGHGI